MKVVDAFNLLSESKYTAYIGQQSTQINKYLLKRKTLLGNLMHINLSTAMHSQDTCFELFLIKEDNVHDKH